MDLCIIINQYMKPVIANLLVNSCKTYIFLFSRYVPFNCIIAKSKLMHLIIIKIKLILWNSYLVQALLKVRKIILFLKITYGYLNVIFIYGLVQYTTKHSAI